MNKILKAMMPTGFLSDPLGIQKKVLGKKTAAFMDDPLNLMPKRPPPVTEYVSGPAGDQTAEGRKRRGYASGLMGVSRLTG